jgi:hypothetical protein
MNSRSVLVDVENTLFDAITPTVERYNRFHCEGSEENENPGFSLDDVSDYDFGRVSSHYLEKTGRPEEERREIFILGEGEDNWPGYLEHSRRVWESNPSRMEVIGDSLKQGFEILDNQFAEINVVTARSNVGRETLKSRLRNEGVKQGGDYNNFCVERPKPFQDYDWVIEDKPEALSRASDQDCSTAKIPMPYNEDSEADIEGRGLKEVAEGIQNVG